MPDLSIPHLSVTIEQILYSAPSSPHLEKLQDLKATRVSPAVLNPGCRMFFLKGTANNLELTVRHRTSPVHQAEGWHKPSVCPHPHQHQQSRPSGTVCSPHWVSCSHLRLCSVLSSSPFLCRAGQCSCLLLSNCVSSSCVCHRFLIFM